MLTELNHKSLKLKIKQWEKQFYETNGHKPSKKDIDSDPSNIRQFYKDYWALIKANRKSQSNLQNTAKSKHTFLLHF